MSDISEQNADILAVAIERLRDLRGHEFWDKVKEINGLFKQLKPIQRDDRERLWEAFNNLCEKAKREKAESNEQAKANAHTIEVEIQSLRQGHWDWFEKQYKDFWAHAKRVSKMFKDLKPLQKDDRDKLWTMFDSICEEIKRKQKTEYENCKLKSEQHKGIIIGQAERARPAGTMIFGPQDVDTMKALGRELKDASSLLSRHKAEMFGEHKQECFERIKEIRAIHDAWWDARKRNSSNRHNEFQSRVRANIEKNRERLRKATDALRKQRDHVSDLSDKISSAWSEEYRTRADEWLSEAEVRIRDIEESIRQIEEWIREDEEKLR